MKVMLDCNVWVDMVQTFGRLPRNGEELNRTAAGVIANAALRGANVDGERITLVVSRHVVLTCEHVVARNGWCAPGEFGAWMQAVVTRLREMDAVDLDGTVEDYPAHAARAARPDGAEDAEDEAVLRCAKATGAVLVTRDTTLASVAGRRGVTATGPEALARRLAR